jgi:putative transposase
LSRSLDGEVIRSATLSRDGKHWFVSFLVDDGLQTPAEHAEPGRAVGVDRGVVVAVATSDGELRDRDFLTAGERRRVRRLQRKLSRCAGRGRNRDKARAALGVIRARERRRRRDFCAQTAHELTVGNALVAVEDLKTKQMTRSAKGNTTEPGRNVKAKSGLNRVLAKGWHQFALALKSAARYSGTRVVVVPAAFTSLRCSACGHVDPKSRDSQAVFRCTHCSRPAEHADVNAAKNILAAGLAVVACEDNACPSRQAESPKQEPAGTREELLLQLT